MKRYVIGLDNGGTSVKAALFDEEGNQIYVSQRKLSMLCDHPEYMERDLDELWHANIECLKEIIEKSGVDSEYIKAMSFSGHGKGLYLLDKEGKNLGNGILSVDHRAQDIVEEWERCKINKEVFKRTFQKVQDVQPVALLAWLKQYKKDVYDEIGTVFAVKDYIRYRLSKERYAEYTDFSGSNLIDFETKTYSKELLHKFNIDEVYTALPALVKSTDICGYITEEAAQLTGLKKGMPLIAGMFDVDACCVGCGIINCDQLAMIAGTWSINVYLSSSYINQKDVLYQSFYALPQYTLIEESSPTSCGNLEWLMKELLNIDDYVQCNAMVESSEPDIDNMIYLPFLYGSNEGNMNGAFINMKSYHKRRDIVRSIYEGIAFAHKTHYLRLLKYRSKPKAIRIAGGIVNSSSWLQIFADVLQTPLEVVENEEFGTQGAAICAGVGAGLYPDYETAIKKNIHIKKVIIPNHEFKQIYEIKYEKYLQAVHRLAKGGV